MAPRRAAALRGDGRSLREHLIVTAERLIAERGTAGLTVRDIARAAGVADGMLYNHFADKEDLLAHALRAYVETAGRSLGDPPAPGTATVEANLRAYLDQALRLHAAILPAFAGLVGQPKVLTRFTELPNPLADGRGLRTGLADYLRAERDLGRVERRANVDVAATLIIGACHELVLSRLFQAPSGTAEAPPGFVEEVVRTVLRGIAPAAA